MLAFRRITAYSLLLVLFLTTGGFTIYIHTCNTSGKSNISVLGEDRSCCGKKETEEKKCCKKKKQKTTHQKKKNCCSDKKFSKQLKVETTSVKKISFEVASVEIPSVVLDFSTLFTESGIYFSYTDPSPPLSGKDLLINHQVFRI